MCEFCSDIAFVFSEKDKIQLSKKINISDVVGNAINALHEGNPISKAVKKALWASHNAPLQKAVGEGFTPSITTIEYGTPNYEFLKQLQTNTAVFSMFKMHASMKDMAALLKDENGNVRSKADFIKEALKVDNKYRTQNLDAEYDTAVRQARMASKWQKFQKNKHLYPSLIYLHTKAANPDPVHLTYVGIIRPVDDPFWDTHYPPSRWRCQCDVDPTDAEDTDIPSNLPPIPADFAFNSGKTGQIFDIKNSDYIKKATAAEIPKLIKEAETFFNADVAEKSPYQPIYKSKSGTLVEAHPLAFNNEDFNQNISYARDLANSKLPVKTIQILPDLKRYPELRKSLLPDAKGLHNPDFRIDGVITDAKEPSEISPSKNTIKNTIKSAHQQGDGIMLFLKPGYISESHLFESVYDKLHYKEYSDFQMYIKNGDEWKMYNRDEFLKEYQERKKPR